MSARKGASGLIAPMSGCNHGRDGTQGAKGRDHNLYAGGLDSKVSGSERVGLVSHIRSRSLRKVHHLGSASIGEDGQERN